MKYVQSKARRSLSRAVAQLEELESRVLLSHGAATSLKATKATTTATTNITIAGNYADALLANEDGYTPAEIKKAYGIDSISFNGVTGDGSGQTIAIVDAYNDPNLVQDLATFDAEYNLATANLIQINENGGTTLPGTDPAGRGNSWALEISLDVEWAHAIAPGATIVLVEATTDSDSDLYKAVNTARNYAGVSVVSTSWGSSETSSDTSDDKYFTTPSGHTNITFVASAGDNGAYGDGDTRQMSVEYPASSGNVVAVGGTSLTLSSDGTYVSETGWGDGSRSSFDGGSGGGISVVESQPTYQSGVVTQSLTQRTVPDVAIDADPDTGVAVVDSYDDPQNPWTVLGGTSLAAPMWGAIISIADQGRVAASESTLTTSQTLTLLYSAPSSDFHDITSGSNGFTATTGYDLVTGLGTPIANLLVAYIVGSTSTSTGGTTGGTTGTGGTTTTSAPTITALTVSPTSTIAGSTITLTASRVTDSDDTVVSVDFYRESNGVTGLQTGTDTLVGTGTQSGSSWTVTSSTASLSPGDYTYYAVATNASGLTSSAPSALLTITAPTAVTAVDNDNFANATTISGTSVSVTGSNVGATLEKGELKKVAGATAGASVWFVWTAAVTGKVALTTAGSTFDTLLAVYTGTKVSKLKTISSNDDDDSDFVTTSALTFAAVAGTTYYVEVAGFQGDQGMIDLNLSQTAAPANNNFANAATVSGDGFTWTGTNDGATLETGEPKIASVTGGSSVWLVWTATSTETVTLTTDGSDFNTLLGVYTGKKVSGLKKIASNNDDVADGLQTSLVSFKVTAGKTYYFDVDGVGGATGDITLAMSSAVSRAP